MNSRDEKKISVISPKKKKHETFRLSLSRPAENNILETKDWSWKLDCPSKAPGVSCVGTRDDSFNTTSVKCSETRVL